MRHLPKVVLSMRAICSGALLVTMTGTVLLASGIVLHSHHIFRGQQVRATLYVFHGFAVTLMSAAIPADDLPFGALLRQLLDHFRSVYRDANMCRQINGGC